MQLNYSCLLPGLFGWWPLGFRRPKSPGGQHIAYIMWHFPLLSESFIQREITALKSKGMKISVVADAVPDTGLLDEAARKLVEDTTTVLPMAREKLTAALRHFVGKAPFRTANALLFLLFHRYHEKKTFRFDTRVFRKSVYIAGLCRELGVTHVHSPWADLNAITGLLASRLLGVPFSVQARAHEIYRESYLYGLEQKFGYAELVITNTNYNAVRVKTIMGDRDSKRIERIYNGIPLQMFPYRLPVVIKDRPVRIITVARLIEQKGIDDLLRACAGLRDAGVSLQASIIGGPEQDYEDYAEKLRRECHELELDHHVEFLGERSLQEIIEYYTLADIFALPSKIAADGSRDIIPNVLIEAMAIGLPCVSTRVAGIPEIIDDGVDGLLVASGDVRGMIDTIARLTENYRLRRKLSVRARRKVESYFDIEKNAEAYRTAFDSIGKQAA